MSAHDPDALTVYVGLPAPIGVLANVLDAVAFVDTTATVRGGDGETLIVTLRPRDEGAS